MKLHGVSKLFFTLALSFATAAPALAHKVNIFAYVEGDTVYTESYFPDGKKVQEGLVEVYDSRENKLLEGRTDREGRFDFRPSVKDDLKIVVTASLGHKNFCLLPAGDLPTAEPAPEIEETTAAGSETGVDLERIKKLIDGSLDEKLKPIVRQLAEDRRKEVSFGEIAGGIGYIVGLTGILFYCLAKKKNR